MSARPETIAQLNNWLETQRRRDIEEALCRLLAHHSPFVRARACELDILISEREVV